MTAGYWFVQPDAPGGAMEPEQHCADCAEVVAKVKAFRVAQRDSKMKVRVHVPSHAIDAERQEIKALEVDEV
jgi:hypothetical protein